MLRFSQSRIKSGKIHRRPIFEALESRDTPSTVILNDSSKGYYSGGIGSTTLFDPPPAIGRGLPQPVLREVGGLGTWLRPGPPVGGVWDVTPPGGFVGPLPQGISGGDIVIYPLDAGATGLNNVNMRFGAENGIFVYLDGVYKFGADEEGPATLGEYSLNFGNLAPGMHYLQLVREHHHPSPFGGGAISTIEVTADPGAFRYTTPAGTSEFQMTLIRSGDSLVLRDAAGRELMKQKESLVAVVEINGQSSRKDILNVNLETIGSAKLPLIHFNDPKSGELRVSGTPAMTGKLGGTSELTQVYMGPHTFFVTGSSTEISISRMKTLDVTTLHRLTFLTAEALSTGKLKIFAGSALAHQVTLNTVANVNVDLSVGDTYIGTPSPNSDIVTLKGATKLGWLYKLSFKTGPGSDRLDVLNPLWLADSGQVSFDGGADGGDSIEGPDIPTTFEITHSLLLTSKTPIRWSNMDHLVGGIVADKFFVGADHYFESIDGGKGSDTVDLSLSSTGGRVDLNAGTLKFISGSDYSPKTVKNIENIIGSGKDDVLIGSAADNKIEGRAGNDAIYANYSLAFSRDGTKVYEDRGGTDTLKGDAGNDTIYSDSRDDIVDGGAGDRDKIVVQAGHEFSMGGEIFELRIHGTEAQNDGWSCGPNSIARMLQALGTNVSYATVRSKVKENSQIAKFELGTLPKALLATLKKWKPDAKMESDASLSRILSLVSKGKPVIFLHASAKKSIVGGQYALLHWAVIRGYNPISKVIDFTDTDNFIDSYTCQEFKTRWRWGNFFTGTGRAAQGTLYGLGLKEDVIVY